MRRLAMVLCVLVLAGTTAWAGGNADKLKALLPDVDGWEADPAEGMDLDMGGTRMSNATRAYQKGDMKIHAVLVVGSSAMVKGRMPEGVNMETDDGSVKTKTIEGCKAVLSHAKKEDSGGIVLMLSESGTQGAILVVSYEKASQEEALAFLDHFDVKKMKATTAGMTK